jgi:hypothetical protein
MRIIADIDSYILAQAQWLTSRPEIIEGSGEAGCNGPYRQQVTPYRAVAHALALTRLASERGHPTVAASCTARGAAVLKSVVEHSAFVRNRSGQGLDEFNGLIGQTWIAEGLLEAYKLNNDKELVNTAADLWCRLGMSERNLWNLPGPVAKPSLSLNQQIYHCYVGLKLDQASGDPDIRLQCEKFITAIGREVRTTTAGRLRHTLRGAPTLRGRASSARTDLRESAVPFYLRRQLGYNPYAIGGLARCLRLAKGRGKSAIGALLTSLEPRIQRLAREATNGRLARNTFAMTYNQAGFDLALAGQILDFDQSIIDGLIRSQITTASRMLQAGGVEDPVTLRLRAYELDGLLDGFEV